MTEQEENEELQKAIDKMKEIHHHLQIVVNGGNKIKQLKNAARLVNVNEAMNACANILAEMKQ